MPIRAKTHPHQPPPGSPPRARARAAHGCDPPGGQWVSEEGASSGAPLAVARRAAFSRTVSRACEARRGEQSRPLRWARPGTAQGCRAPEERDRGADSPFAPVAQASSGTADQIRQSSCPLTVQYVTKSPVLHV
eukprot:scaffold6786_cov384-Prasinococcus_capsulatus_cf.AAC.16